MGPAVQQETATVSLADLTPDPKNARRHTPRNVGTIVDALHEVGAARSIVIDEDGVILAGNATVEAAAEAGIQRVQIVDADGETLVAVRRTGLTPAQKQRLALFDNRAAELAEWDAERLATFLAEDAASLEGLFHDDELEGLLAATRPPASADPGPQLDRAEELRTKWATERGQLWTIGRHRLLCGDATSAEDHVRALDGVRPDAVVTDPPYGVGADYRQFDDSGANVRALIERFMPLLAGMRPLVLTPGIPMMWFYPSPTWLMAWVHPAPAGGCPWGFGGLNPILVYGDDPYLKAGLGRRPDSLILAADRGGQEGHPTPKPLAVWIWLVERVTTRAGQVIFDPFCGAGTTLVAAEQTDRVGVGLEIDPAYVAVILERLAGMGLAPRLAD